MSADFAALLSSVTMALERSRFSTEAIITNLRGVHEPLLWCSRHNDGSGLVELPETLLSLSTAARQNQESTPLRQLSATLLCAANHAIPRSMLRKDPHMLAAAARDVGAVVAASRVSSREDLKASSAAFTSLMVLLAGVDSRAAASLLDDTLLLMLDALEFLVCLQSGTIPSECHLRTEAWPDLAAHLKCVAPAELPTLPGVHDAVLLLWQGRSPLRQWVAFASLQLSALPADVLALAQLPVLQDVAAAGAAWLASGDDTMVHTTAELLLRGLRRLIAVCGSPVVDAMDCPALLAQAAGRGAGAAGHTGMLQLLFECCSNSAMSGADTRAAPALMGALRSAPRWAAEGALPPALLVSALRRLVQPTAPQQLQAAAWECALGLLTCGASAASAVSGVLLSQVLDEEGLAPGAQDGLVQACQGSSLLSSGHAMDDSPPAVWPLPHLHAALLYVLTGAMQLSGAPPAAAGDDAAPLAMCIGSAQPHAESLIAALSQSSIPKVRSLADELPSSAVAAACSEVAAQLFLAAQGTAQWKDIERFSHAFLLRCVPICRDALQDVCLAAEAAFDGGQPLHRDAHRSAVWALQVSAALLRTYAYDKVQRLTAPTVAASLACFRAVAASGPSAEGGVSKSGGGVAGADAIFPSLPGVAPAGLSESRLEASCGMHRERVPVSAASPSRPSAVARGADGGAAGLMSLAVQLLLLLAPQALRETVRRASSGRAAVVAGFNDASALINKATQGGGVPLTALLSGPYEPSAMVETRKLLSHTLVCAAHVALTWGGQDAVSQTVQGVVSDVFSRMCSCVFASLVEVAVTYDAPLAVADNMHSCLAQHEGDMLTAAQSLSDFHSNGGRVLNGRPVDGPGAAAVCRSLAASVLAWRQNTLVSHTQWCERVLSGLVEAVLPPHTAVCGALQFALTHLHPAEHASAVPASLPALAAAQVASGCDTLLRQAVLCSSLNAMRACLRAAPVAEHKRICEARAAAPVAGRSGGAGGRKRPRRDSDAGAPVVGEGGVSSFSSVCDPFISGGTEPALSFVAVSSATQAALQGAVTAVFAEVRAACERAPLQEQDCHPMSSADAAAAFVSSAMRGAGAATCGDDQAGSCPEWALVGACPRGPTQLGAANGKAALFVGDAAGAQGEGSESISFADSDADADVLVVEEEAGAGSGSGGGGQVSAGSFLGALVAACHALRQHSLRHSGVSSLLLSAAPAACVQFWGAGGGMASAATELALNHASGALLSLQLPARRGDAAKHWQPHLMRAMRCAVQLGAVAGLLLASAAAGSAPSVAAVRGMPRLSAAMQVLGRSLAWLHVLHIASGTEALLGADLEEGMLEGHPILAVEEAATLPVLAAGGGGGASGGAGATEKRPRADTGEGGGADIDVWGKLAAQLLSEGGWYAWLQHAASELLAAFAEAAPRTITLRMLCTDAPRLPDAASCWLDALSEMQLSVAAWGDVALQAAPSAAQHGGATVTARQVACAEAVLWDTMLGSVHCEGLPTRHSLQDVSSRSHQWLLWRPQLPPTAKPDRAGNIARLGTAMQALQSPSSLGVFSQALSALTLRARPMSIDALGDFGHFRDPHTAPGYHRLRLLEAALEGSCRSMRQGASGPSLRAAAAARRFVASTRPPVAPLRWGVPLHLALYAGEHARFVSNKLLRDTAGAVFCVHLFQSTAAMASVGERKLCSELQLAESAPPAVLTVTELITSVCTFWLPGLFLLKGRSRTTALTAFAALLVPVMVPVHPSVDAPLLRELTRHRVATGKTAVHRALQHALTMRMRTLACHCMVRILVCLTGSGGSAVSALQALGAAMNAQTSMAPEAASATACTLLSRFVVTTLELLVWQLGDGAAPFSWRVVQALCVAGNAVLSDEAKHSPLPAYINMDEISGQRRCRDRNPVGAYPGSSGDPGGRRRVERGNAQLFRHLLSVHLCRTCGRRLSARGA